MSTTCAPSTGRTAGTDPTAGHEVDTMIDRRPAITLEELLRVAPLMSRIDRKYLVPVTDLPLFLTGLEPDTRVLEIGGRREFDYRSVYFDTPDLHSYRSTVHRRRRRFKIRTRSYLDSGLHVLELKVRGTRGLTSKLRIPYAGDGLDLTADARTALGPALLDAQLTSLDTSALDRVLDTGYRRTTLYLPAGRDRVTIDHGLTWRLADGRAHGRSAGLAGIVVVEVKSARSTSGADRLLWSMGIRPAVLSKYGTGLALLRPELPATPWTPVLRRQITPYLHQEIS